MKPTIEDGNQRYGTNLGRGKIITYVTIKECLYSGIKVKGILSSFLNLAHGT
jgi:hypothetical protein